MNKQIIVTILLTALIAGLVGFYGGRYFERQSFRGNAGSSRPNMRQFPDGFQPPEGFERPSGAPVPDSAEDSTTTGETETQ